MSIINVNIRIPNQNLVWGQDLDFRFGDLKKFRKILGGKGGRTKTGAKTCLLRIRVERSVEEVVEFCY